MGEEKLTLCPPKRGSKTDFTTTTPQSENGRGPPSYEGAANLQTPEEGVLGVKATLEGKGKETGADSLSGEFPLEGGRDEVSSGPRPPRWRERKGSPADCHHPHGVGSHLKLL